MPESIEALAYGEARRAIDAQGSALESLRTRAATVLSAAALVTAFLGGLSLAPSTAITPGLVQRQVLTGWSWTAIVAFCGVVVLSLVILFPYKWWSQMSATQLMTDALTARASITDVQRDLARYLDDHRKDNSKLIFRLALAFGASGLLLLLEAVAWVVNLTT